MKKPHDVYVSKKLVITAEELLEFWEFCTEEPNDEELEDMIYGDEI